MRVGLRGEGRTTTLPHEDQARPDAAAAADRGRGRVPASGPIVIDGLRRQTATARVAAPARKPRFSVWRTDTARSRARSSKRLPGAGKAARGLGRHGSAAASRRPART